MTQVSLIQSGCQQWIKQPAAVHGDQFAFSSSLAIFVHASDSYRLLKLLAQQTQHINAICWSPVDAKLIACSNAEKAIKVYNLETDAAVYISHFPYPDIVSSLRWATHDENMLLAAAGSAVAFWPYKSTSEWKCLHNFKGNITSMQQSATEPRLLAVGCTDASLHLFDMLLRKVVCTVKLDEAAVPCDLQFDPLSKAYLLLLCSNGAISLYGVGGEGNTLDLVSSLAKQPAARRSAAFVPDAPGSFAVISTKSGIMQVCNVSQQQPLHSLKVGSTPAQSLNFFPGSSRALITFQDGSVVVYDVAGQEKLWSTQPGHTETIFDCCFAPGPSSDLLATCSFDGTVRVWDAATNTHLKTLDTKAPGREEVVVKGVPSNALYSVTWSPDCSLLAASSAGGAVYLFDYAKGVVLKNWQLHSKPSLRVTWHPTKPTLLASSSIDGSVVAFQTDGSKLKVLQHSGAASGCAWARDGYLLATTSEAGTVHVWDLNIEGDDCLVHSLHGHAKRSFSVVWSPLLPHLLLSGSDDNTARVWDAKAGSCLALLAGHQTEVRALCWHPELPWLVLTGSWDSTIRCWDWRNQSAVHVCTQHHSDVYGLSIHSSCPWLLASASRDSTLRFWDLTGLTAGILTRCFLTGVVPRGQAERCRDQTDLLLCGPTSHHLADWIAVHCSTAAAGAAAKPEQLPPAACIELFSRLSGMFTIPGFSQALWQLAASVASHLGMDTMGAGCALGTASGADTLARSSSNMLAVRLSAAGSLKESQNKPLAGSISLDSRTGSICGTMGNVNCGCTGPGCLCHLAKIRSGLMSAANQLELSVRGRGVGRVCMGAARREEVLQEAAVLHLQAGDAERSCELLVELGHWDKALALAPAVSQSYWRQLMQRKVVAMSKEAAPAKELLPHMIAAGQVGPAVELLMRKKQYDLAAKIAAVAACGGYARFSADDSSSVRPGAFSPPPRSNSILSPIGSPSSQTAGALHVQGSAQLGDSMDSMKLHHALKQQPGLAGTASGPLSGAPLSKRNSLPPLRSMNSMSGVGADPLTSPTAAAASAFGAAPGAGGLTASMSGNSLAPLGAGSRAGSCAGLSTAPQSGMATAGAAPGAAQPASMSPTEVPALLQQQSGRLRQSVGQGRGAAAAGIAADTSAPNDFELVCRAQTELYRSQGQPIKAACAALMVHDVSAAVTALHLGHEPEQAAMLCIALGRAAGLQEGLTDRVFEALAIKCEAAGDWQAASLALRHLSKDVQHQQQLLAVRQETANSKADAAEDRDSTEGNAPADGQKQAPPGSSSSSLRQELQLQGAERCGCLARSAADAVDSVRFLLLGSEHDHAAAKAINSMQPLLADLQQQLLRRISAAGTACPHSSSSSSRSAVPSTDGAPAAAGPQQLLTCSAVVQLARWHTCLESLDKSELPLSCWHAVFAHLLLTGALRAFDFGYQQVGSFLLTRLRHWTEEHQLQFPLSRPVVLLLEAELLRHSNPEAAASLLQAVLVCADGAADARAAAEDALQAQATHMQAQPASSASSSCVVASNSDLPHRPPPFAIKRSALSGKLLSSGPWAYADDVGSLLSLSEAVMLSHVMRFGPYGTGQILRLLV